jgi:serine/threonine-protein kinase
MYMAPECFTEGAGCQSDLYSVAVVLYEMVTGRTPFAGDQGEHLKQTVLKDMPIPPIKRNPAVSRELNSMIMQGLEKDPVRRFFDWDGISGELSRGPAAV